MGNSLLEEECRCDPLRPGPFMLLTETARRPGDAPRTPRGGALGGGRDTGGARFDLAGEGGG